MSAVRDEGLLTGDSPFIQPEDEEEAKFYRTAFKAADGMFREKLYTQQKMAINKRVQRLRRKLAQSSKYRAIQGSQIDGADETVDDDEDDVVEAMDELDSDEEAEVSTQLKAYEKRLVEISAQVRKCKEEAEAARAEIKKMTRTDFIGSQQSDAGRECEKMKQSILRLAMQLDPLAKTAAEALGYFYLRTPAFLYQNGLTDFQLTDSQLGEDIYSDQTMQERREGKLPPIREEHIGLPASQTFRIFEDLDNVAILAMNQDDKAVCELLSILGNFALPRSAHDHLTRIVMQTYQNVKRIDACYGAEEPGQCPVIALWPQPGQGARQNADAYKIIRDDITKLCTKSMDRLPSRYANSFATIAKDEKGPDTGEKLTAIKKVITAGYVELKQRDCWLHLTPQVIEVLLHISERALSDLQTELYHVYGHEDSSYVSWTTTGTSADMKHWYQRRQAASRVCELAMEHNELALHVVANRLLKDRHWMVRQATLSETPRLIGILPREHSCKKMLIDMVAKEIFEHPDFDAKGLVPTEAEIQEGHNVQVAAQRALERALPNYNFDTKKQVLEACRVAVDWCPAANQPIYDRLLKKTPHVDTIADKIKAASSSQNNSLRKARQREATRRDRTPSPS